MKEISKYGGTGKIPRSETTVPCHAGLGISNHSLNNYIRLARPDGWCGSSLGVARFLSYLLPYLLQPYGLMPKAFEDSLKVSSLWMKRSPVWMKVPSN